MNDRPFHYNNPVRDEFKVSHRISSPKSRTRRKKNPVMVVRVDSRIWEKAMEIADGDTKRIQILSEEDVIVHNSYRSKRSAEKRV